MARYLVTGGAGFIGSHLTDKLIENGHQVLVIDNLSTGKKEYINTKAKFYNLDISDYKKIKPFFNGIDCVFHLAAIPRVPVSVKDPVDTTRANILGTVSVFKAAVDANVKRVVFASSSSVYGKQKKLPLQETMIPNPLSPYGLQKLVGEQFAKMFSKLYGIEIVCLRYFNVYGPRIDFGSDYSLVLGRFLKLEFHHKPLTIYGSGNQTRAFSYIDDVIDASIKASKSKKIHGFFVINVGQEKSYSINYLAQLINGKKQYLPPREGDPPHTKADISLAKKLLGWKPRVDFKDGVFMTREWFKEKYGQQ